MFRLAKRAKNEVSAIRQIFQQIKSIEKEREEKGLSSLIDLSIGQPHIPPNPEVIKRLEEMKPSAISQGYSSSQGEPETLEAIVRLYQCYYPRVQYKKEEVMTTIGGSGALSNIFSILVENESDVILTFEPFFAAYTGQIKEWGGTLKKIPTLQNQFRPTADALETMLRKYPDAKALIMNYPNNPSGIALKHQEAIDIVNILEKYPHVLVIIDDVYRDFNYQTHVTLLDVAPNFKDRCVIINSGAKGLLGAPGERVGMVAAHEELIKAMLLRQTNGLSSVPYRTQAALRFAVENYLNNLTNDWLMNARREYKANLDIASDAFKKCGFGVSEPDGAFYLLVCAKHLIGKIHTETKQELKSDIELARYFLNTAGVAVVPGSGFGIDPQEGYLRISCAKKNNLLIEAVTRIAEAANALTERPKQSFSTSDSRLLFNQNNNVRNDNRFDIQQGKVNSI